MRTSSGRRVRHRDRAGLAATFGRLLVASRPGQAVARRAPQAGRQSVEGAVHLAVRPRVLVEAAGRGRPVAHDVTRGPSHEPFRARGRGAHVDREDERPDGPEHRPELGRPLVGGRLGVRDEQDGPRPLAGRERGRGVDERRLRAARAVADGVGAHRVLEHVGLVAPVGQEGLLLEGRDEHGLLARRHAAGEGPQRLQDEGEVGAHAAARVEGEDDRRGRLHDLARDTVAPGSTVAV